MNSYYSNLIEGHKTLPRDIERALRDDLSDREDDRRNQLLSVAHIRAEAAMRRWLAEQPQTGVFQPDFIQWIHREFYKNLPPHEWFTTSVSGKRHPLEPGNLRGHLVRLLKALCLEGDLPRGAVPAILGLKGTASRVIIRRALDEGLICSSSEKGPLRIAFPYKVVDSCFPLLFTDLPVDHG